jgi:Ni,Fe-hydrogenase III large subunit
MEKINIIGSIGSDIEDSFRNLITVIEQLRKELDELQEWKKKISSIE